MAEIWPVQKTNEDQHTKCWMPNEQVILHGVEQMLI